MIELVGYLWRLCRGPDLGEEFAVGWLLWTIDVVRALVRTAVYHVMMLGKGGR